MNLLQRLLRRGGAPAPSFHPCDLSAPLLDWAPGATWTVRDAVEGTLVTGATGSGKTSGSGRLIAGAFLARGFGGLVLTAKAEERKLWESYCDEAGRRKDLIVFGAGAEHRFNFLDYELTRQGEGAGLTENIVNLFSTVLEIASRGNGSSGRGRDEEGYFRRAGRQLTRNAVDLLSLARGRVTVPDLYKVVISAPTSMEQVMSAAWRDRSLCFACFQEAKERAATPRAKYDLDVTGEFFFMEWPQLADRTRTSILSTFTSMADVLMRGLLRELFCEDTTISPDAIGSGKILVIDLPVKEFADVGLFAQVLWKNAFQRAVERREGGPRTCPVFLWADEAQYFITSGDQQFQTTCRSSRVATVLLTQNVSNVYAALGGEEAGKAQADSLFANLNTKIMHSNGDPVTNEWAASLIGKSLQSLASSNSSHTQDDGFFGIPTPTMLGPRAQVSAGFSESWQHEVPPSEFTRLRRGGPASRGVVEGIVFQGGRSFGERGRAWIKAEFNQSRGGTAA